MDLALNNLQRLICHKTHQTKPSFFKMWHLNMAYFTILTVNCLDKVGRGEDT